MYRQVFVPNEQNAILELPTEWLGMEVVVLAYPIMDKQVKIDKESTWIDDNSMINNPLHIGKNFRKIAREEIYDR